MRDENRLFARLNDIKGSLISTVRYIDAHANSVQSLDRFSPKMGQLTIPFLSKPDRANSSIILNSLLSKFIPIDSEVTVFKLYTIELSCPNRLKA